MNNKKPEIHRTLTRGESPLTLARDRLHRRNLLSVLALICSGFLVVLVHLRGGGEWWFYIATGLFWCAQAVLIWMNHIEFARFIDMYYPPPYQYTRRGK